jgi:outer membrane protein
MSIRTLLSNALFIASSIVILSSCTKKKTGYVDVFKLVNEFELQKEYTAQVKNKLDREKAMVDSVVFAEKLKNPSSAETVKNSLYGELYNKTQSINKEIEGMIWKRLNPYLVDFGKEQGYLYIYGANGTGNVLYADASEDITEEIIKYVNKRYHDKK